jgi:hypothetical protein
VDYFVHEGMFIPEAAEAIVAGLAAAILSYGVGSLIAFYRKSRKSHKSRKAAPAAVSEVTEMDLLLESRVTMCPKYLLNKDQA